MLTPMIGDWVRIRPDYCDRPDEHAIVFVVVEWNGDRGFVAPLDWENPLLVPQELVRIDMLEQVTR